MCCNPALFSLCNYFCNYSFSKYFYPKKKKKTGSDLTAWLCAWQNLTAELVICDDCQAEIHKLLLA